MSDVKPNYREAGFTLVETMFVLSVFLIIASVTTIQLKPSFQTANKQFFLTQLSNDLYYAQMYAIANETEVHVVFAAEQHFYYFRVKTNTIFRREYDENISIEPGTLHLNFQYLPSGNINKFGAFIVRIDDVKYRVVMQLGKGRFYIDEV